MAEKTPYHEQLQQEIKTLKDGFDIKSLEADLLKNELIEVDRVNVLLSKQSQYVLQMLDELIEYEKKNKLTERLKASKIRLKEMFSITTELSGLGDKNRSLKLFNRELFGIIQQLRIENGNLRKDNETMKKAFNGL